MTIQRIHLASWSHTRSSRFFIRSVGVPRMMQYTTPHHRGIHPHCEVVGGASLHTHGRLACFVPPRLDLVQLPETAIGLAVSLSLWEAIGRLLRKSSKKGPYCFAWSNLLKISDSCTPSWNTSRNCSCIGVWARPNLRQSLLPVRPATVVLHVDSEPLIRFSFFRD